MNRYVLCLNGCSEEEAKEIHQNIRFWCIDYMELPDGNIEVTTSYDFTPEFLEFKGIPADRVVRGKNR